MVFMAAAMLLLSIGDGPVEATMLPIVVLLRHKLRGAMFAGSAGRLTAARALT